MILSTNNTEPGRAGADSISWDSHHHREAINTKPLTVDFHKKIAQFRVLCSLQTLYKPLKSELCKIESNGKWPHAVLQHKFYSKYLILDQMSDSLTMALQFYTHLTLQIAPRLLEHTQHIAPAPGPGMLSVVPRCDDKQAQFIGSLTWPTNKPNNK